MTSSIELWRKAMASKIYLYGTVGYDIDANYVRLALDEADGDLELRINSGGGDVFEGQAIYSLLESWKATTGNRVLVYIDGIAASVASVIAMAGSEIHMSSNALMMIHNPWTPSAVGGSDDLRDLANVLDKIRETIVTVYETRSGIDRDAIGLMMDEETWFTAAEAVNFGFADQIVNASEETVASIKAFNYVNAPDWVQAVEPVEDDAAEPVAVRRSLAKAKLALERCCNKTSKN
jgi:ATP-dependent protease ClpP protease subunit